jgi:hypothetical protein
MLSAMYIRCNTEITGANTDTSGPTMTINQAHDRLAHSGEENTQRTAKELGWTLARGNLKPCDACPTGKAKQKNVPKVSENQATTADKPRVFLDRHNYV